MYIVCPALVTDAVVLFWEQRIIVQYLSTHEGFITIRKRSVYTCHPWADTHPGRNTLGKHPPPGRHPLGRHPLRQIPTHPPTSRWLLAGGCDSGRGHAWREMHSMFQGACGYSLWHAWQGYTHLPTGRYYEIWSMSGRYASYWNAILVCYYHTQITERAEEVFLMSL